MGRNALIINIIEKFTKFGLSFETLNIIEDYLSKDESEEKVKEALSNEKLDSDFFVQVFMNEFASLLREFSSEEKDLFNKTLKMLFMMGKEKVFGIWGFQWFFKEKLSKLQIQLEGLNVPFYYYILHKASRIKENSYTVYSEAGRVYFDELRKIYKSYKKEFIDAYNNSEGEVKLCLAIVRLNEGSEDIEEIQKSIDGTLKDYIFGFFKCNCENELEIKDYLNGNDEALEKAVERLKIMTSGIDKDKNEYRYEYGKISAVVYHSSIKNQCGKRILRILTYYDSQNTLDAIFECASEDLYDRHSRHAYKRQRQMNTFQMKLKEIGVTDKFYLAWAANEYFHAELYDNTKEYLKGVIDGYFKSDLECFKNAINLTTDFAKEFLEGYLIKLESEDKAIEETLLKCTEAFKEILIEHKFSEDEIRDFILYMEEKKEIEKVLIPLKFKDVQYVRFYKTEDNLKRVIWYKDVSEVFKKIIRYVIALKNKELFEYFIILFEKEGQGTFDKFIKIVDELEVDIKEIFPLVLAMKIDGYYRKQSGELVKKWIEDKPYEVIDNIQYCSAEGRSDLIDLIYESGFKRKDYKKFKALLKEFVCDSSKVVKETAMKIIEQALVKKERKELAISLLEDKKAALRESAVKILGNLLDEECKEILFEQFEKEKSSKVKKVIKEYINIQEEDSNSEEEEIKDINKYCEKNLNKRKKAKIKWLEINTLPKLIIKESGESASEAVVQYILIAFADNKDVNINLEIKEMMSYFTEDSLGNMTYEVLTRWYAAGAEAKKKWIFSAVGMLGDGRTVELLNKYIRKWPQEARNAIACEALKALAINNSDEAFMIIDSIARKFKYKKVKQAAGDALEFAAKELGIDKEELSDRIVPKLGFDANGQRTFDYGNRKFIVEITPELKLSVFKEDGKVLKNLPAVGKNDNEEMAAKAREEFKLMKKQLKTLVDDQSTRLEMALSINRKWTLEKWNKLFVENIIMNRFATGLIWGIYDGDKLKESFRYMEDGTFNTVDEDEFEIPQGAEIGLVHPVELSDDALKAWKEQLEDYEIVQPIEQLHRETFLLENSEAVYIDKFEGRKLSGSTLLSKLTKRGWYTGSVRDGGWYTEFYKEDEKSGLGAEIEFSGMGFYDVYNEVEVSALRFYKAGTVKRGSYVYDAITKKNIILPKDIPARFFSEILYDINVATLKNS